MTPTNRRSPPLVGAVRLPDGSWVRGRSVRAPLPPGAEPTLGLYLGVPYAPRWEHHHVSWPDFWLPGDPRATAALLRDAHAHALAGGRLEIGCRGGRGRTGTALAALAILAGVRPDDAVRWTRETYDHHAVETPWQRRWVRRFPTLLDAVSDA
jgi:hypothetical protein